jgi:hypothetical protein
MYWGKKKGDLDNSFYGCPRDALSDSKEHGALRKLRRPLDCRCGPPSGRGRQDFARVSPGVQFFLLLALLVYFFTTIYLCGDIVPVSPRAPLGQHVC